MNAITEIAPGIRYVGVNDRTTHRFEALWSLPYGVSYNSYLIDDERTALIDGVDAGFVDALVDNIRDVLGDRQLDYLVINHMEPDHSGAVRALRRIYPGLQIVGNAKTLQMVAGYYGITDSVVEVRDGETLSLGRHTLRFYLAPMIHWPETMVTFCEQARLLFSGDAFGTFGALDGGVVDSQLECSHFWDEMRRYYACIVSKYGKPVQTAMARLSALDIDAICPTHGPVWREHAAEVLALYDSMSRHEGLTGAVVAYGSMYGNTAAAAERVARELAAAGVRPVVVHNLSTSDPSVVLRDVHKYKALIVGSPTYNGALFPEVAALLQRISERNVAPRIFAFFGSFTWAGAAVRQMRSFAESVKWEIACEPFEFRQGCPPAGCSDFAALASAVAEKLKE
ncbi:MAG: FprA family A-type flavoprotein [Alistipes sp.]|nr:FprA family A-type flavoprotein [Alistipes sp.]